MPWKKEMAELLFREANLTVKVQLQRKQFLAKRQRSIHRVQGNGARKSTIMLEQGHRHFAMRFLTAIRAEA